jgi:hypothetical protein
MTKMIIHTLLVLAVLAFFLLSMQSFEYTISIGESSDLPVLIIIGVFFLALFLFMNQKEII